ncbi:hypothetical protein [Paraburkholderia sp. ZP32-5]|uniref:hypothetical protein n=1 Tax=Paraburkholderia sp. ZP32-5 TaxID=2883245 RepID=UPI001F364BE0|nr:hypothetical protein [Paraburkholderia sp. ZP32-5]
MTESDLIEFNLKLRAWAEKYIKWSPWHPIDGALLLSGLNPSNRWDTLKACDWGSLEHRAVSKLVSDAADSANMPIEEPKGAPLFNQLPVGEPEGARLFKSESRRRLRDVCTILEVWNDFCEGLLSDGTSVPTELRYDEFVGWWWEYGDDSPLRNSTYFDAFVELCQFPSKKNNNHTPFDLVRQAASRGAEARNSDTHKKHDLIMEIEKARDSARRSGADQYSAADVFPLLVEILRTGESRNATLVEFIEKKSLTYRKDGANTIMRFDSFARYLRKRRNHERAS